MLPAQDQKTVVEDLRVEDAEALIEEARRHQRTRQARIVATLLVLVGLGVGVGFFGSGGGGGHVRNAGGGGRPGGASSAPSSDSSQVLTSLRLPASGYELGCRAALSTGAFRVGRAGIEPATLGLRVPCSAN